MASQTDEMRAATEADLELCRADTLNQTDAYRLQLEDNALGALSLHYAIGSLVAAVTIPEPPSFEDCLQRLRLRSDEIASNDDYLDNEDVDDDGAADEDRDDERVGDEDVDDEYVAHDENSDDDASYELSKPRVAESFVRALLDQVNQRIASGALASLIPVAQDAAACDEWIAGLHSWVNQTLHDATDEEAKISLRISAEYDGDDRVTRAQRKERARTSLAADVTRLIQLWSEVPPYDPEQEAARWSKVVRKPAPEEPKEKVIHSGGTFVRAEAKVGRNDLCPCGSGKKYKKCCG